MRRLGFQRREPASVILGNQRVHDLAQFVAGENAVAHNAVLDIADQFLDFVRRPLGRSLGR